MLLSQGFRNKFVVTIRTADRAIDIDFVAFELVLVWEGLLAAIALQWVDLLDLFSMNILFMLPGFN
jgi:hypothetical protein